MSDNRILTTENIFFSCLFPDEQIDELRIPQHVIMHVVSGEMSVDDHEKRLIVTGGQTVFIRRDHEVRVTKNGKDGFPFSAVSIVFDREFLRSYFNDNIEKSSLSEKFAKLDRSAIILETDTDITDKLIALRKYIGAEKLPDKQEAESLKSEVLDSLLDAKPELYPVLFDFNEQWKIDILEFMEKHFKAQLSISEFASYTGRSLAGFKRDFAKISELTPQKWIIEHRLDYALKLIVKEKKSVNEAFFNAGFKNRTHFVRVFKERFGVAPSDATPDTLYKS